jgi:hypothetical protein
MAGSSIHTAAEVRRKKPLPTTLWLLPKFRQNVRCGEPFDSGVFKIVVVRPDWCAGVKLQGKARDIFRIPASDSTFCFGNALAAQRRELRHFPVLRDGREADPARAVSAEILAERIYLGCFVCWCFRRVCTDR